MTALLVLGIAIGAGHMLVVTPILFYRGVPQRVLVGLAFIVGGAVFGGLFAGHDILIIQRTKNWKQSEALILHSWDKDGDGSLVDLQVRFRTALGQEHEAVTQGPESTVWRAVDCLPDKDGYKVFKGCPIAVVYDPEDPRSVEVKAVADTRAWGYALLFGGSFIPLGIGLLYGPTRNHFRRQRLVSTGTRLTVTIADIRQDRTYVRRAGEDEPLECPWIIRAEWRDPQTGRRHQLLSGPLWDDPQALVHEGGTIDVVMDLRRSPAMYALDTWPLGKPWVVKTLDT